MPSPFDKRESLLADVAQAEIDEAIGIGENVDHDGEDGQPADDPLEDSGYWLSSGGATPVHLPHDPVVNSGPWEVVNDMGFGNFEIAQRKQNVAD